MTRTSSTCPLKPEDQIRPRVRAPVSRSSCVRSHRWPLIRHRVGRVRRSWTAHLLAALENGARCRREALDRQIRVDNAAGAPFVAVERARSGRCPLLPAVPICSTRLRIHATYARVSANGGNATITGDRLHTGVVAASARERLPWYRSIRYRRGLTLASMFSRTSKTFCTPRWAAVSGMSCIRPRAPFGDTARGWKLDSTRMTDSTSAGARAWRAAASQMKDR